MAKEMTNSTGCGCVDGNCAASEIRDEKKQIDNEFLYLDQELCRADRTRRNFMFAGEKIDMMAPAKV